MKEDKTVGLREKKTAKTKADLLRAMLKLIKSRPLAEISVAQLCEKAFISEATFFNYFPKKTDLLLYYIQIWSIEVSFIASKKSDLKGLKAIEAVFKHTADMTIKNPLLMKEIIRSQMDWIDLSNLKPVTPYERKLIIGQGADIADFQDQGLHQLLLRLIGEAVKLKELPKKIDVEEINLALRTIFFGSHISLPPWQSKSIAAVYQRQLDLLWAGYNAR